MEKKNYLFVFAMLMMISSTLSALPPGDYTGGCFVNFEQPLDARWETLILCEDGYGSVSIDESIDKLMVDASSSTCGQPFGEKDWFNGIISAPVSGDFEVVVLASIISDSAWSAGSRGGIMIGRNITEGSPGIAAVNIRPKNSEYRFYYDSDGDGVMDAWDQPGKHDGTSWLKIVRKGDTISGYYMSEGFGHTGWNELGTHVVGFGDEPLQIALGAGELAMHFDSLYMSTCPDLADSIFTNVEGGTAVVTTTPADKSFAGSEVIIDVTDIEAGKRVQSVAVNDTVVVTEVEPNAKYSFVMPADTSAHVNVVLEDIPVYDITVSAVAGGTAVVTTDPVGQSVADSLVTITIADIEAGKLVDSIAVVGANDDVLVLTEVEADSIYTFTMPAQAVTVSVMLADVTYGITANASGGTADVTTTPETEAVESDLVTVDIANIESGKEFDTIEVVGDDLSVIPVTELTPGVQYTFTMPAQPVTITVTLNTVTVVNEIEQNQSLVVYPNPVTDVLTVSADAQIQLMTLTDVTGALVIQQQVNGNTTTIDMAELSAGTYLLNVVTENDNIAKQVIKK